MTRNQIFFVLLILLTCTVELSQAQIKSVPYSFQQNLQLSESLYSPHTRFHTATKPQLLSGALLTKLDSIQSLNATSSDNWFMRKLFNEHVVQVEKEDHSFYLNVMPDFLIGTDLMGDKRTTWLNTRGLELGLTVNNKLSFHTSFYENQGVFAEYMTDYINGAEVIPGQGTVKSKDLSNEKDWMYATASLTYDFSKYFQATIAYDKNHIGDGYRSLLLSDASSNYTHLKLTGTIGNVQYTSIWAYMNDPRNPRVDALGESDRYGNGVKWGAFQYLDYNATNRLSVGFFQAITWADRDEAGKRGFDFNYLNPAIFLRPVESNNSSSPDKMFLGLNARYKILDNLSAYGQFLLGEFTAKEFFAGNGYMHNKWGTQIGVRGFNIFKVQNLNFLAEYNVVRPYTYQHLKSSSNYSNHGEALAHPRGANFKELLAVANYSWQRFNFSLQGMYSRYGTDPADGTNMGGDIFQSYRTAPEVYGNYIGQGVKNDLFFADAKAAYVLNPKYNLRLELGYTQRYNKVENAATQKSGVVSFGLRSSFRNFYADR